MANNVVNAVDTLWFAVYIPVVDFSFSLSRLRWIFLDDDDNDDEHLFAFERKEKKRMT